MLKTLAILLFGGLMLAMFPAMADQWDKKTIVKFSAPVELPGIVLPAGTYVFKLLNSASNRNIVEVFNADESHLYKMFMALPNYRLNQTSETVLRFEERPKGNPEAIRAWFYPADNFGQEFVYPKKRAAELAEAAQVPVLAAELPPAAKPEELVKEPVVAITPEKKEVEIAEVEVTRAIEPEPAPPVVAEAAPLPPAEELPKTASPLPLIILVGLGSLALAGAFRIVAKHSA